MDDKKQIMEANLANYFGGIVQAVETAKLPQQREEITVPSWDPQPVDQVPASRKRHLHLVK